jgi:uncharacterized protein involved in cysteine biosynthesis
LKASISEEQKTLAHLPLFPVLNFSLLKGWLLKFKFLVFSMRYFDWPITNQKLKFQRLLNIDVHIGRWIATCYRYMKRGGEL